MESPKDICLQIQEALPGAQLEDVLGRDLAGKVRVTASARPTADAVFRDALESLLNAHSRENGSNTPDFILAEYLDDCLAAFDKAVRARSQWHNPNAGSRNEDKPISGYGG